MTSGTKLLTPFHTSKQFIIFGSPFLAEGLYIYIIYKDLGLYKKILYSSYKMYIISYNFLGLYERILYSHYNIYIILYILLGII